MISEMKIMREMFPAKTRKEQSPPSKKFWETVVTRMKGEEEYKCSERENYWRSVLARLFVCICR